jgi:hypothetical protein
MAYFVGIDVSQRQVSGLPPEEWPSLGYGFAPAGGREDGEEAAHGRGDRQQAAAGRRADGSGPTGGGGDRGERGQLRDELLDGEMFYALAEAKIVIEGWRGTVAKIPAATRGSVSRPASISYILWPD